MSISIENLGQSRRSRELVLATRFLKRMERALNAIELQPRNPNRYPFDCVALEIVNKSFALARSCLSLIRNGFPDEAYGLSRSIIECAMNLRFITQNPIAQGDRTKLFYIVEMTDKRSWLEFARSYLTDSEMLKGLEAYAAEIRLEERFPDAQEPRHWSHLRGFVWRVATEEHPLDQDMNPERLRKIAYALDYAYASQYVHCSQVAIGSYLPEFGVWQRPFKVSRSAPEKDIPGDRVYWIIGIYLNAAIRYAFFGMGMDDKSYVFGRSLGIYLNFLHRERLASNRVPDQSSVH